MKRERLLNFELLRVLAMLLIITGHLLGDNGGDLLGKQPLFSFLWFVLWGIEAICVIGTNCFILISGYFLVDHIFTWKKVLKLCVEVWFYSLFIYIVSLIMGITKFNRGTALQVFTPILGRTWWFISTYIGMYVLSPYINKLIEAIDKHTHEVLIIICVMLFSLIPTFYPFKDTFSTGGGGGLVWFLSIYLIAAYFKKYEIHVAFTKRKKMLVYFCLAICLMILSKYSIAALTKKVFGNPIGTSLFFSNNSILNLIASVCLFLLFRELKLNSVPTIVIKIIELAGSVSFGVYMIHNNPWLSPAIWKGINTFFYTDNKILILIMVIIIPFGIYLLCGFIELMRKKLFALLKLPH